MKPLSVSPILAGIGALSTLFVLLLALSAVGMPMGCMWGGMPAPLMSSWGPWGVWSRLFMGPFMMAMPLGIGVLLFMAGYWLARSGKQEFVIEESAAG